MSEQISVSVTQEDFILIRTSLHHTISSFKHILETSQYPPGFNEEGVRSLIMMNSQLLEKINTILAMKPVSSYNVGVTNPV